MSLEYEQGLSLEELKRRNQPAPPTPAAPETHPTAEEWEEMLELLRANCQLMMELGSGLHRLSDRLGLYGVETQLKKLTQEVTSVNRALEQAGRQNERRRFSLADIPLPNLDGPEWYCLLMPLAALAMTWLVLGGGWKLLVGLLP